MGRRLVLGLLYGTFARIICKSLEVLLPHSVINLFRLWVTLFYKRKYLQTLVPYSSSPAAQH